MDDVTNRIDARDKAVRENARLVEQLAEYTRQINLLRRALSAVNKNHAETKAELATTAALAKTLLEENARLEQTVQGANELFMSIRAFLTCPLAARNGHPNELLRDPVVASDGHTYERDELDRHAAVCHALGKPPDSPVFPGSPLGEILVPNRVVGDIVRIYEDLQI